LTVRAANVTPGPKLASWSLDMKCRDQPVVLLTRSVGPADRRSELPESGSVTVATAKPFVNKALSAGCDRNECAVRTDRWMTAALRMLSV